MLDGLHVLVGVTGGIAAYKTAMLVSLLKKAGADVHVVMTEAATRFVAPLTFETMSGNPVAIDTFSREVPWEVEHISLAKQADLAIVAPATANTIAKLAYGIADNMLTTTLLAYKKKLYLAPAMNTAMLEHPATQQNIKTLVERGAGVIAPDSGLLACGDIGSGRMAEPQEIFNYIWADLTSVKDLEGKRVLITAGPTREAIDPVRYLTNRSSGKMGYALATAARNRGAQVTLISGPVSMQSPGGVTLVSVESARQMYDMVMHHKGDQDIIIMSAAVADYTPRTVSDQKIKKQDAAVIELEKTTDILRELGAQKHCYLAGFAAETQRLEQYAKDKLEKKNLDMIIANDVSDSSIGFDSEQNAVTIYKRDGGSVHVSRRSKLEVADRILDEIVRESQPK